MRVAFLIAVGLVFAANASAQPCMQQQVQNYTGAGQVACPCFVAGEQAGSVLTVPAEHFPIEILRIGVGWGSAFGGAPNTVEEAIHIYPAGLPAPGAPVFTLKGPMLSDGFINEFNLEPLPEIALTSGPFMVALEFANSNAGNPFAPSVVHDGTACQAGKNTVFDGMWRDACALGVTGDWVFYVKYRCLGPTDSPREEVASTLPLLGAPHPNPFTRQVAIEFRVAGDTDAGLSIFDVRGRRVAELSNGIVPSGSHVVQWDGRDTSGQRLQPGVYFAELRAGSMRSSRKIVMR